MATCTSRLVTTRLRRKRRASRSIYGKILRIDVDSAQPYAVPPTNPFVDTPGARPEIWSYGFRNPWRFSFDRATSDMWIGDVGDASWEEVDMQPASSHGGENYGWPYFEGTDCMNPDHCQDGGMVATAGDVWPQHDVRGHGRLRVPRSERARVHRQISLWRPVHRRCVHHDGDAQQGWTRVELGFKPIKIDSFAEDPAVTCTSWTCRAE